MVPIYKFLLANKVRVLIYSGDTDFAVPFTGSAFWTSSTYLPLSKKIDQLTICFIRHGPHHHWPALEAMVVQGQ